MKKILLACLIGAASLATLGSCTKEYITNNFLPSKTMVYTVLKNPINNSDLKWTNNGNRVNVVLPVPELTERYTSQGQVIVSISTDNEKTFQSIGTSNAVAFSFDYEIGLVNVKLEDPILENGLIVNIPEKSVFKVTLLEADYID